MPMKMPRGSFASLDLYGHPIGVNLNGKSMFKTKLGSLITLMTYALILFNLVNLFKDFSSKDG